MTYKETTDYLFAKTANYEHQGKAGYKPGLANMLELNEHLGHPHRNYLTIHVAGTNGKGSVSHSLAAFMQTMGMKVGLYTSPHLVDFSERIRVNGIPVSEDYVVAFVDQHRDIIDRLQPSFFEITTAMAFKYFSDEEVDIAIVEVGLGGRLDSTNIITPILSVVTNISLDHTQLLGNTLQEIAREKAGIMKPGVPCVVGEALPETRPVFEEVARLTLSPLYFAEDEPLIVASEPLKGKPGRHYTTCLGFEFDGDLQGDFQSHNVNTVLRAIDILGLPKWLSLACKALGHVASLTGLRGRWQTIHQQPTVVCDIGHNQGAWQQLGPLLHSVRCRQMHIVFGMLADKDVSSVLNMLPKSASYYFTKAGTHRAMPEAQLAALASKTGLKGKCYPTVREAYNAAMESAENDDFVFVGGSNYVVAEVLETVI